MPVTMKEAKAMYAEVEHLALKMFNRDLTKEGWTFRTNRRKRAVGVCFYGRMTIEVSADYMSVNTYRQIKDTIIHEVAHAVAGHDAAHGPEWQHVCVALGGNGEQYASERKGHTNKVKPAYVLMNTVDPENPVIVKEFYRKPTADYSRYTVNGDRSTLGKLVVVKV